MLDLGSVTYSLTMKTRSDVTTWSPDAVTSMTRRMIKSRQDIIKYQCMSVRPSASRGVKSALRTQASFLLNRALLVSGSMILI